MIDADNFFRKKVKKYFFPKRYSRYRIFQIMRFEFPRSVEISINELFFIIAHCSQYRTLTSNLPAGFYLFYSSLRAQYRCRGFGLPEDFLWQLLLLLSRRSSNWTASQQVDAAERRWGEKVKPFYIQLI